MVQSLKNRRGEPDPDDFYVREDQQIDGINIRVEYATKEHIDRVHGAGGYIGAWYGKWRREDARSPVNYLTTEQLESGDYFGVDGSHSVAEPDMWKRVFAEERVDFFYSNSPVEAMQARDMYLKDVKQLMDDFKHKFLQ